MGYSATVTVINRKTAEIGVLEPARFRKFRRRYQVPIETWQRDRTRPLLPDKQQRTNSSGKPALPGSRDLLLLIRRNGLHRARTALLDEYSGRSFFQTGLNAQQQWANAVAADSTRWRQARLAAYATETPFQKRPPLFDASAGMGTGARRFY
jgi:hypothetical protein